MDGLVVVMTVPVLLTAAAIANSIWKLWRERTISARPMALGPGLLMGAVVGTGVGTALVMALSRDPIWILWFTIGGTIIGHAGDLIGAPPD